MLYESLRKLIVEAASPNAEHIFKGLDLTFSVQVTADEGDGSQVELIKGGKNVAVTSSNVHEYVRLYAEHRMVGNNKRALQVCSVYHLLVITHVLNELGSGYLFQKLSLLPEKDLKVCKLTKCQCFSFRYDLATRLSFSNKSILNICI